MPYDMRGTCWHCGAPLQHRDYGRESTCPACGKPTHVCLNCRFHDTNRPNACAEPIADPVADKQRSNFCGYFEATERKAPEEDGEDALRQAAEDLFRS